MFENDNVKELNDSFKGTLGFHLGIEILGASRDCVKGKMAVDERTVQPFRELHGGASAALAESLASIGANLNVDSQSERCVGIELHCSHIKSVKEGFVYGTATPVRIGRSVHLWQIKIVNESGKLISLCHLTLFVKRIRKENI